MKDKKDWCSVVVLLVLFSWWLEGCGNVTCADGNHGMGKPYCEVGLIRTLDCVQAIKACREGSIEQ